ncbi:MAG: cation:proton antiporter [Pseudoalteromonas sp.]|uniref:cation:proton antiporter n=1 Tax=Pseudoalteromonas sp. TaxID=53249 RepID=UPI0025F6C792|nr:cation:proton antiporter [Pseudoalteromonas sp.]MCH2089155.1 cation:proton antiporter [Pseudoalteromonas sp.]
MEYTILALVGLALLFYSLTIRQLERTEITGPMFFVLVGIAMSYFLPSEFKLGEAGLSDILPLVELTLSIFLFTDAAKSKLPVLKHSYQYPGLLLFVALPMTLVLGVAGGLFFFSELSLFQSALIAIILTPTDAALSKGILECTSVPEKVREGINTESGLNDGLCVPIFLILLLLAQNPESAVTTIDTLLVFARELGVALIVAGVSMAVFIPLLKIALARHYFANNSSPFLLIGLVMAIFSLTQNFHGSGFIAVFVSGLLFDYLAPKKIRSTLVKDSEHIAEFVALLIWCLFGFVCGHLIVNDITWPIVFYALLSVTIFRIVPVLLSLMFTNLNFKDKFTFAWFGPRGLASIVFTLMVMDTAIENKEQIATVTLTTILFSVFIHGMSTKPIAKSYQ